MLRAGLGHLVVVDGIINEESFLNLLVSMCSLALVKDFLTRESISALPWPAKSPDLNLIQNLWALVKRKLAAEFPITKTRSDSQRPSL